MKKLLSLLLMAALPALAQVTVGEPWVRATVAAQKATGAFMTLTSTQTTKLVGASSPAAGAVEVHEMKMDNDMMRMFLKSMPINSMPMLMSDGGKAITAFMLDEYAKIAETAE